MKKVFVSILFVFVSFFFCYRNVYAFVANNLSYEIQKISINGDSKNKYFDIEGWALIDHMDNYGKDSKNDGNLTTTIIASLSSNASNLTSANSYFISTTPTSNKNGRSFYLGRCANTGCNESVEKGRLDYIQRHSDFRNFVYDNQNSATPDADVIYHNVYFNTKIYFNEIINKFKDSFETDGVKDIYFYIKVVVKPKNHAAVKKIVPIGFPPSACSWSEGCAAGKNTPVHIGFQYEDDVTGDKTTIDSIEVSGLKSKFYITAENATAKNKYNASKSEVSNYVYNSYYGYFKSYNDYILRSASQISAIDTYKSAWRKFYRVYCNCSGYYCSFTNGKSGGECYMPNDWGYVSGNFSIKISFEAAKKSCTCFGGNCNVEGSDPPSCRPREETKELDKRNYSGGTCGKTDVNFDTKQRVRANYYYRISMNEFAEAIKKDKNVSVPRTADKFWIKNAEVSADGWIYLPVWFYEDINFSQASSLNIYRDSWWYGKDFVNNTLTVDAGRPFAFAMKFSATVSVSPGNWNYQNWFDIKFDYRSGGKKVNDNKVQIFFDFDNAKDRVFFKPGSVVTNSVLINQVADHMVDSHNGWNFNDVKQKLVGNFPDSNKSYSYAKRTENIINPGEFVNDSGINPETDFKTGRTFTIDYYYKILRAYNGVGSGTDCEFCYGQTKYGPSGLNLPELKCLDNDRRDDKACGSVYYVPRNMNTTNSENPFQFKMVGDLSLIEGVEWNYDATCNLQVINQLKDNLYYRPINVKNPFPKAKVGDYTSYPKNWQEYVKTNGLGRINDTFNNNYLYQTDFVTVSYFNRNYVSDVGYGSIDDIENNGSSKYINSHSQLFPVTSTGYCQLGQFNERC